MKIQIGDIITVTDDQYTYKHYTKMARLLDIEYWVEGKKPYEGKQYIVKAITKHLRIKNKTVCYIQDPDTEQGYIINIDGITFYSKQPFFSDKEFML